MPKKPKKSKPAKKSAPKKVKRTKKPAAKPVVQKPAEKPAKETETMDRVALKVIVSQLKEMGSDIKVFKSDTDDGLQKKVNEALQKLPPPDVMKKLESVVPDKLVTVLKRDCVGLFIDLSDVSCVRCKDSGMCAREFLKNVKGGLTDFTKALPEAKTEEVKAPKTKLAPATRYEADRIVIVMDRPNPNPVGDDYHDTFQTVLDGGGPITLSELREIVERDFTIDSDADFMKLVTNMRDPVEGFIKLDVDLTEKDKARLRKAGVEI